jgi:hypothetical protein
LLVSSLVSVAYEKAVKEERLKKEMEMVTRETDIYMERVARANDIAKALARNTKSTSTDPTKQVG